MNAKCVGILQVIFRSAHMGGSSGTGLRLDTVCYRMAPAEVQSTKTISGRLISHAI